MNLFNIGLSSDKYHLVSYSRCILYNYLVNSNIHYNPILCYLAQIPYDNTIISCLSCDVLTVLCLLSNTMSNEKLKYSFVGLLNENLNGFMNILLSNLKDVNENLSQNIVILLRVIFETQPGLASYIMYLYFI